MSKQKKGGIINNFRLTLVDDDTHDKLWSRKFTRMGALVTAITTVVVTITVIFCLIAFTPIRTLIPGYPDARTKHDAIQNAIRVDSLQNVIMKWELYSENLRRVVDGQEPLKIDSLMEVRKNVTETVDPKKLAEKDSLLRKEVANRGQVRRQVQFLKVASDRGDAFLHTAERRCLAGVRQSPASLHRHHGPRQLGGDVGS